MPDPVRRIVTAGNRKEKSGRFRIAQQYRTARYLARFDNDLKVLVKNSAIVTAANRILERVLRKYMLPEDLAAQTAEES